MAWDAGVWEDPIEAENPEPSDSQGFFSPEEVVSPPLAEDVLLSPGPELLPLQTLAEEINASLSTKPSVTFSEDAWQDNTDIPQGAPIVTSRPITDLRLSRLDWR